MVCERRQSCPTCLALARHQSLVLPMAAMPRCADAVATVAVAACACKCGGLGPQAPLLHPPPPKTPRAVLFFIIVFTCAFFFCLYMLRIRHFMCNRRCTHIRLVCNRHTIVVGSCSVSTPRSNSCDTTQPIFQMCCRACQC